MPRCSHGLRSKGARGVAVLALVVFGAHGVAAQSLKIGMGAPFTSADPQFFNASPNISLGMHVFDTLISRDAGTQLRPALALSWTPVSDTVWEFKLRPDVTWHDGSAFTAEDVVFSLARVPTIAGSPASFTTFVRAIQKVDALDPLTLRITTAQPHPLLPVDLASVAIVSRAAVVNAGTDAFSGGKAAMGTGPYRLAGFTPGSKAELVRNPAYWGGPQHWQQVELRIMSNAAARSAAILSGDVDVIDQVSAADLPRLRADSRVAVAEIPGLRTVYLVPDRSQQDGALGATDTAGRPLAKNPFNDLRVRQALTLAIDRDALVTRVMEGNATATGQWLPPGLFGYNAAIAVPKADPAAARALLAEAGYPDGFRMTLSTSNDRLPNDARTAQAVAQMWTRIGVQTQVEALPWSAYSGRIMKSEYGMSLLGWGSTTGEASYALVNVMQSYNPAGRVGVANVGRYSNPELDALVTRAATTIDEAQRRTMLEQAVKMAVDDVAVIPLFQLKNSWATRAGLRMEPRMDDRTLAMGVSPDRP
jgi:peptide/nickel transport system substrate-binding protein